MRIQSDLLTHQCCSNTGGGARKWTKHWRWGRELDKRGGQKYFFRSPDGGPLVSDGYEMMTSRMTGGKRMELGEEILQSWKTEFGSGLGLGTGNQKLCQNG